jgi:opacity protein-like surface antigen
MKIKPAFKLLALLALAYLLAPPLTVRAEMYVEAYLGANFAGSPAYSIDGHWTNAGAAGPFIFNSSERIDPAVVGGLKIGTWFVKEGFLGQNYPEWMKYFGFYFDFSYHRLDFSRQNGTWIYPTLGQSYINNLYSNGSAATMAFMFAARYGLFPDQEVPFGRLQPYVAVGPAILFSSQQPSFFAVPITDNWTLKAPSRSSTDIALAAEAGLRWMALKNVSLDVSFKYLYAQPSYNYSGIIDAFNRVQSFTFSPVYNFFRVQAGVAYHF